MNKRIYLILLPLLALILSVINCKQDSYASFGKPGQEFNISVGHHPYSVNLNKDTSHKHKNAIRIKAWDDATAMIAPASWIPFTRLCYYTPPAYSYYRSPVCALRFSRHKLRGPPTV
jgi:hypothetical protein